MVVALVCGGGNAAHVLAGMGASRPDTEVRVLTLYADEAERWEKALEGTTLCVTSKPDKKSYTANPTKVSKDPAKVVPGSDIIMITVPAFAHAQYFSAIKPHMKEGVVIVGLPGRAGFDFAAHGILGEKASCCTLISFESLPWACRLTEYGLSASILGTKQVLQGAMQLGTPNPPQDPVAMMQRLLGERPVLKTSGHLLSMTLMAVNSYIHPSIMYGRWHDYDGLPLKDAPLFYQGVDEMAANMLTKTSDEGVSVAKEIMKLRPAVDLTTVTPIIEWYQRCYSGEIGDPTNLMTSLHTNKAYDGLKHPVTENEDESVVPNFKYRYLTEDLPFGLAVVRGVAEIMKISTPNIDKVLLWGQEKIGKEYLVQGKLNGKDVCETRAPQAYGLTTLDAVLGF
uniref:Alanopine dehydrogenase n=1 Tax=Sipunculus nudus TaxID=6446 RepID=B6YPR6_SIPNU|nr:alanopine dehydrogenase [Sipunculus nudus]